MRPSGGGGWIGCTKESTCTSCGTSCCIGGWISSGVGASSDSTFSGSSGSIFGISSWMIFLLFRRLWLVRAVLHELADPSRATVDGEGDDEADD